MLMIFWTEVLQKSFMGI